MTRQRWPRWVYADGEEPDYRFSFANERTFLAWIRTALGFVAAGVALDTLTDDLAGATRSALAALLVILGICCSVAAFARWAAAERAIRRQLPLPAQAFSVVLAAALTLMAFVLLLVMT